MTLAKRIKSAAARLVKAEIAFNRAATNDLSTAQRKLLVARKRFNEAVDRVSPTIQTIKANY